MGARDEVRRGMLPLGRSTNSRLFHSKLGAGMRSGRGMLPLGKLGAGMEAAGIEPASRERRLQASTRLFRLLISLKDAPAVRIVLEPVR